MTMLGGRTYQDGLGGSRRVKIVYYPFTVTITASLIDLN